MHSVVFTYSILQYLVDQSNLFRSLMGLSSGIRIKLTFHKTEQAITIYTHQLDATLLKNCIVF